MDDTNDRRAFLRHFLANRDSLYAFILVMVRDPALAEDIFQDVSVVLWEKFGSFEEGTSFAAWARQIAYNKIRNERRGQARAVLAAAPEALAATTAAFEKIDGLGGEEEWHGSLRRCLDRLSDTARRLVDLRYYEGFGLETIAAQLGRSVGGVNSALCKVRLALENCLRQSLAKRG